MWKVRHTCGREYLLPTGAVKLRRKCICKLKNNWTHCKRGHELSGENVYVDPKGQRYCRCCSQLSKKKLVPVIAARYQEKRKNSEWLERRQRLLRERRKETKRTLVDYKGGCCMDCHNSFPLECFHFDHRDPFTKLFDIGAKMNRPMELLKAEVDKCDLVCANCHAIRTASDPAISKKISAAKIAQWVISTEEDRGHCHRSYNPEQTQSNEVA